MRAALRVLPCALFLLAATAGCLQKDGGDPTTSALLITITSDDDPFVVHATGTFSDAESPASIHWDWGDGTSGNGDPGMSHTYIRNGTYTVTASADHPTSGQLTISQDILIGTIIHPDDDEEPDLNETTEPDWGEPAGKGIRPGVNIVTEGSACTSSFLFTDGWQRYYLSTAAHCVEDGESSETDGCSAPLHDSDIRSEIRLDGGGTVEVPVAYSSWRVMQDQGDASAAACAGNDFALLDVTDHVDDVHPASLHFRAPTGLAVTSTVDIWGYGASSLKAGVEEAHPKRGYHLGLSNDGWSHLVYLATPGIPGDSGGHIMTVDGLALGVASTILLTPFPGANHYTDISRAVAYAEDTTDLQLELVTWDDFNSSLT